MNLNQFRTAFIAAAKNHTETVKQDGKEITITPQMFAEEAFAELEKVYRPNGKGNYYKFQEIKHQLFEIIAETIDLVLPEKVLKQMEQFAEVKTLGYEEKNIFTLKRGMNRGKSYLAQGALSAPGRAFRLDTETYTIPVENWQISINYQMEQFLAGRVTPSELMAIVEEAMMDLMYVRVQKALGDLTTSTPGLPLPAANLETAAGSAGAVVDLDAMRTLINRARGYGQNITIFCTQMFAQHLYNAPAFTPASGIVYSSSELDDVRKQGYVGEIYGVKIVVIPNAPMDETNTSWTLRNDLAYILPTGDKKIVKVVFEGQTIIKEREGIDNSTIMEVNRKSGVGVLTANQVFIYKSTNSELTDRNY